MKKASALILAAVLLLTGCSAKGSSESSSVDEKYSGSVFAMDTFITVTAYGANGEQGIEAAKSEITRLEKLWSVTDEGSEIYALDHSGGKEVTICPETAELIYYAKDMYSQTDGALDITLYPVLRAWGFTTGEYRVPDDDEISELLTHKGVEYINLNGESASLPEECEIDLGAVAKGCAGDKAAEALKKQGVTSALLDLGGNIQTVGDTKPDGTKWNVGIRDPFGDGIIGTLEIGECAVITSGGYERFFDQDGVTYTHILDPETGRPAESGLVSATAVGREGRRCDALSTSLYVMGLEKAEGYWRSCDDFDMILITDDGKVYITEGLENSFTPNYGKAAVIRR